MSNPHRRHRRSSKPAAPNSKKSNGKPPSGGKAAPKTLPRPNPRTRWFYDVRQYALLRDDEGNLLILQLPKEYDASAANTWTLPGGKLEPLDEPGEGLLREIAEETGLTATLVGPCNVARWTSRNSKKLGIFYLATVAGTKPELKLSGEHQRAIWVSAAELNDFPFHRPEMRTAVQQTLEKRS